MLARIDIAFGDMKTVITHFYNEEYLLPQWLNHHKKIFDFGILIDYHSTDNSVNICKEICPDWMIFTSMNEYFDARNCDYEVEFYERQVNGWRITLTVTEFLMGNIDQLSINTPARMQWYIPGIRFTEWNPNGKLDSNIPLWHQLKNGIDYKKDPVAHQCRSYHNFNDITYTVGRHYNPPNTEDCVIFHYAHCIVGEQMVKRRLQIQDKIPDSDKQSGLGSHHYFDNNGLNLENLKLMHNEWINLGSEDLSNTIEKFL